MSTEAGALPTWPPDDDPIWLPVVDGVEPSVVLELGPIVAAWIGPDAVDPDLPDHAGRVEDLRPAADLWRELRDPEFADPGEVRAFLAALLEPEAEGRGTGSSGRGRGSEGPPEESEDGSDDRDDEAESEADDGESEADDDGEQPEPGRQDQEPPNREPEEEEGPEEDEEPEDGEAEEQDDGGADGGDQGDGAEGDDGEGDDGSDQGESEEGEDGEEEGEAEAADDGDDGDDESEDGDEADDGDESEAEDGDKEEGEESEDEGLEDGEDGEDDRDEDEKEEPEEDPEEDDEEEPEEDQEHDGVALLLIGAGKPDEGDEDPEEESPDGNVPAIESSRDDRRETLSKLLPSLRHEVGGPTGTIDPRKLEELAGRFERDPQWKKLLQVIGRLSRSAWSPPARVLSNAREDVVDLELGDDPTRILSTELARFGVTELAGRAYVDLLERRMVQIAVTGDEPRSNGPILAAADMSGSMDLDSGLGMDRARLATVLLLSLVRIADVQKRKLFACGFTEAVNWSLEVRNPREAVDAALFLVRGPPCRGGTRFDPALELLCSRAESDSRSGADILFITDGESTVSPKVGKRLDAVRKKNGTRLFSLLLQASSPYEYYSSGSSLEAVSDQVVRLSSWEDLETLTEQISSRGRQRPVATSSDNGIGSGHPRRSFP